MKSEVVGQDAFRLCLRESWPILYAVCMQFAPGYEGTRVVGGSPEGVRAGDREHHALRMLGCSSCPARRFRACSPRG